MKLNDPNDIAAARLRVLEGKVDELPVSADGEILLPGMTVYQIVHGVSLTKRGQRGSYVMERRVDGLEWYKGRIAPYAPDGWGDDFTPETLWVSRDEAEEAAKGNRVADPVIRRKTRK